MPIIYPYLYPHIDTCLYIYSDVYISMSTHMY